MLLLGAYLPECLNLTPDLSWIIRWILGVYAPVYAYSGQVDPFLVILTRISHEK